MRIAPDGAAADTDLTPDISVGDDDVLHIAYFDAAAALNGSVIRHKTLPADDWTDVSAFGWNQDIVGASVGTFTADIAFNFGFDHLTRTAFNDRTSAATTLIHLFPTVVVDKARTPDRVYVFWKHTDATAITPAAIGADENIRFGDFNYDGSVGGNANWGTPSDAFPTGAGTTLYQVNGSGLFQNSTRYQVESFWGYVDRIAAVVDDRIPNSSGDVHIVFSGGGSQRGPVMTQALTTTGQADHLYYSRLDATSSEWELPTVVASARHTATSGTGTAVADGGVLAKHRSLFSPDLAVLSGDPNVYMGFVGGSPRTSSSPVKERVSRIGDNDTAFNPGRGFATLHTGDVQPAAYFKILGRVVTFDDVSSPPGGFQYQLTYNPVVPQTSAVKQLVTTTSGDNSDGSGIGAAQPGSVSAPGGFLTGQWRAISTFTLGVTSLTPGTAGAVFKGANSQAQANNINALNTSLQLELYYYPDNGLNSVLDIRTFATLIVDEQDDATVTAAPASGNGSGDFVEGTGATNVQTYTWDDPGATLQALGFAPLTKTLDGNFFIYIVADDQINAPVFAVSAGAMTVRHVPIVRALAPVATDTVDTGEFTDLSKTNPYTIKFTVDDFDDNAQMRLFSSITSGLEASSVTLTGTFPNLTIELAGATAIQLSDTLRSDEDVDFDFDVTAQGASGDSIITQGSYNLYIVVADDDTFTVGQSSLPLSVRHSPAFEFTNPITGEVDKINTTQQFSYSFEWQRGRSDQDLDGNAIISLYYVGTDPQATNFSGSDSTSLISGGAVLIAGNIREDDEQASDQFIWDFRNPPSELPNTMRSIPDAAATNSTNPHVYQVGEVDDTVWVYAVVHDSLGNTTVENGGAVLLVGSQETPGSQAPKVTMLTPPSGDLELTNGDVVRLEWDAFLIDDGTGTDDAYLRLYAAPAGKYTTITDLETHNIADTPPLGEQADVILINSITGRDDTPKESDSSFFLWDTKTSSFGITGTPIDFDIYIAGSTDPDFGDNVTVNGVIDSIATGIGSNALRAVLSRAPGTLNDWHGPDLQSRAESRWFDSYIRRHA